MNWDTQQTILITGVAGFIGSNLAKRLLTLNYQVIGIDNLNDYYNPEWKRQNLIALQEFPAFHFFEADIFDTTTLQKISELGPFQAIIHLAARAGVRTSLTETELYSLVNVVGTTRMLEFARKNQIPKFIFASSSSVYGDQASVPFTETDPCNHPVSPYAATKKSAEMICYSYAQLYQISVTCLRFFTVYGPAGRPDMAPYLFTEKILRGETITQYGDGSTQRDYTYIDDILAGIFSSLSLSSQFEVINLGNNSPVTMKEFIITLERVTGQKAHIQVQPVPAGDVSQTWADIKKAQDLLDFQPQTSLEEGLTKFVEWFKEHRL